ncbi:MAG: deoxyribonuclease IV [bacterium]
MPATITFPADLLGAHVSVAGGVDNAVARAAVLPAGAFQIFTKNQNQWLGKELTESMVASWFREMARHGFSSRQVCCHDSYLINLAATNRTTLRRSRVAFVDEIERAARLGIPWLVFHPGSHVGSGEATGVAAVARNLDHCIELAAAGRFAGTDQVTLCLENTAGQGSNLGYRFAHLRDIIAASSYPERLGVCLDTCHLFAAGYPLQTVSQWRRTLARLAERVGLERVRVMHLNDSKREFDSRVDRHARIGQGCIGEKPFGHIVRTRRLANALKVLEVPGGEEVYAADLTLLRRLRQGRRSAGSGRPHR